MYVSHQLGIMGYLSWSVPMMAYALVSGSTYAMTGAISAIDSSAKSGAAKGADIASTGNLSMGNDSLRNYSSMDKSMRNTSRLNKSIGNKIMDNAKEGTKIYGSGTVDGNNLIEGISGGALNSENFNGSVGYTGGQVNLNGQVSRAGLQRLINNKDITGNAKNNIEEQLKDNPNAQEFTLTAAGTVAGGFSAITVVRAQQASKINTGKTDNTSKTELGSSLTARGNHVTPYTDKISKLAPLVLGNGLYQQRGSGKNKTWDYKGVINAKQAQKLINDKALTGQAGVNMEDMIKKDPNGVFNMEATGLGKQMSGIKVTSDKTTEMATNGNMGNLLAKKIGDYTDNYIKRIKNSSGTSWDKHYNDKQKYFGTIYHTPPQTFNQPMVSSQSPLGTLRSSTPGMFSMMLGHDKSAQYAFTNENQNAIGKYLKNDKDISISSKNASILSTGAGFKLLGDGIIKKMNSDISAGTTFTMSSNKLRTSLGDQLTKINDKYNSGQITKAQYTKDINGTLLAYRDIAQAGVGMKDVGTLAGSKANRLKNYANPTKLNSALNKGSSVEIKKGENAFTVNSIKKDNNFVAGRMAGYIDNGLRSVGLKNWANGFYNDLNPEQKAGANGVIKK